MQSPFYQQPVTPTEPQRKHFNRFYRIDEADAVKALLEYINATPELEHQIDGLARKLVACVREHQSDQSLIEAFMLQYDLSMEEGVLMMCLAEALLRVPDKKTEQLLLQDKLTSAEWDRHIGESESSFVNMATWGLALSGKILKANRAPGTYFKSLWQRLLRTSGEPVIRRCVREAMKILSKQFVIGQTIDDAISRSKDLMAQGYCFSYDMLGEVARTQKDADRYFQSYFDAISAIGRVNKNKTLINGMSISVKLSALSPRYDYKDRQAVVPHLIERVKTLVLHAKENNMSVTVDAEEADRLDMSLDIIAGIFTAPEFADWEGLGLALQAYQKRAFYVIDYLIDLARRSGKRIQVRLVKGAYWDSEIKHAQVEGFSGYPVFTRKASTDISYLACAKKMLQAQDAIYPQFATHNAHTIASILTLVSASSQPMEYEFQSLQGMGRALHNEVIDPSAYNVPCRIYAPVGGHQDLLPYLVRRLLENGANSSFVNKIQDASVPIATLVQSPIAELRAFSAIPNPKIPLPDHIFGASRVNAAGFDLSDMHMQKKLADGFAVASAQEWTATPRLIEVEKAAMQPVISPTDAKTVVGYAAKAAVADVAEAMMTAHQGFLSWMQRPVSERAAIIRLLGDLIEQHMYDFMYLAVSEAGKTLQDAIAEVREAVDFCRYYAEQAECTLEDRIMPGPTGESNILHMQGRGVMVCISPWNFPLAIFIGQVTAALVAGNAVVAKPADQTTLIAALAVRLCYQAGVPESVLQFMPGPGSTVGQQCIEHPKVAGVLFTGSTQTAQRIQKTLADRHGPIIPFIAETGGMNAMIADSTALTEQLVKDVIDSAFGSAGQRCSALRILYVQRDIADKVMDMLAGAMAELSVDDPIYLSTDVGPVIDQAAADMLAAHCKAMDQAGRLIYACDVPASLHGHFIAPRAYELEDPAILTQEVFGPILHVVRYDSSQLDQVIDQINGFGYGLTFGIQSRITHTIEYIQRRIMVGNVYVNRNMIGAVVGVQPFGGLGFSGTGPKAGGPHYLIRLSQEKTITVNTTAVGGNASLMAMDE